MVYICCPYNQANNTLTTRKGASMYPPYGVFLYKYNRLEELYSSGNLYGLLEASAIIRHMLIDKNSLVDQVKGQTKITFEVVPDLLERNIAVFQDEPLFKNARRSSFVDISGGGYGRDDVSVERFLATKIFYHEGAMFSVKQLVKFFANVKGGVHLDQRVRDEDYKAMEALEKAISIPIVDENFRVISNHVYFQAIGTISKIVLDGLRVLIRSEDTCAG